ncbi:MAG: phosphatase PAP2 family protein [Planctomycetota bacterium]|jgi:membrane-associated phospholipid phosphatase
MVLAAVVSLSVILTGCAETSANGDLRWQDILPLDGERFGRAVHNAFWDMQTLVPAAGAVVFCTVDDFDERVSNWATKHNPVFGSEKAARDWSDNLRWALRAEAGTTLLIATLTDDDVASNIRRHVGEWGAWGATSAATDFLKDTVNRTRPDGSSRRSFPSGHTSEAFSLATLANRNLDYIDLESVYLPNKLRRPLQLANIGLAGGVAWGRVEGRKHWPSDVLAGAALGHFLTTLIHDYFVDPPEADKFHFLIVPHKAGAMVQLGFSF